MESLLQRSVKLEEKRKQKETEMMKDYTFKPSTASKRSSISMERINELIKTESEKKQ